MGAPLRKKQQAYSLSILLKIDFLITEYWEILKIRKREEGGSRGREGGGERGIRRREWRFCFETQNEPHLRLAEWLCLQVRGAPSSSLLSLLGVSLPSASTPGEESKAHLGWRGLGQGPLVAGCSGQFPRKPRLGGGAVHSSWHSAAPEETHTGPLCCPLTVLPATGPPHVCTGKGGGASGTLVSESCLGSAYLCFLLSPEPTWALPGLTGLLPSALVRSSGSSDLSHHLLLPQADLPQLGSLASELRALFA